jgi:apolipoprotein N-acyltransferase
METVMRGSETMKLCPECSNSPWPFVMVVFLASFIAFITWLTLSLSELGAVERLAGSLAVFVAVAGTLVHYVLSCMKRHCRHGPETGHTHRTAH